MHTGWIADELFQFYPLWLSFKNRNFDHNIKICTVMTNKDPQRFMRPIAKTQIALRIELLLLEAICKQKINAWNKMEK